MSIEALPFVVLQGLFFGTTLVASRFSVGQYPPTLYIGLRFFLASLGHLAIYALSRRQRFPRDVVVWRRAVLLGIFGTAIPMTGIVTSLQFQSSGVTAVLITASPALTVLLAHFTLPDERLTQRTVLGVALALGGALLLAFLGETGLPDLRQANPIGYGLVFFAMMCSAAMNIYARKRMRDFNLFDVASIRMFSAAVVVLPLTLLILGLELNNVDYRGYAALGYATIFGTVLGHLISFYIIKRFGATSVALVGYVIPVVATLAGAFILDEAVTPGMVIGMGLIILGITIINRRARAAPEVV